MKKALLLFISLALYYSICAQTLSPFVISSSGNYSISGGTSLSSTTGESTMIQTFSSGSTILTQGFQQPNDLSVGIVGPENYFTILWYPNPSSGLLSLESDFPWAGRFSYRIIDALGRVVYQAEEKVNRGMYKQRISLYSLADGLYHVETTLENENTKRIFTQVDILSIIH